MQELQATVYESTISEMQSELDRRLDEVTASKDEDAEVIRYKLLSVPCYICSHMLVLDKTCE